MLPVMYEACRFGISKFTGIILVMPEAEKNPEQIPSKISKPSTLCSWRNRATES